MSAVLAAAARGMARAVAAGATTWVVAPDRVEQGRRVAAACNRLGAAGHPMPAALVEPASPAVLRHLVASGDVLLALVDGRSEAVALTGLLRRAGAWGLRRVVVGAGDRPPVLEAEHVVWLELDSAVADRSGELARCHLRLLELAARHLQDPGAGDRCITCSDVAIPAEVRRVLDGEAEVLAGGRLEMVAVGLIDGVAEGDVLLCHAGVAISRLDAGRSGTGSGPVPEPEPEPEPEPWRPAGPDPWSEPEPWRPAVPDPWSEPEGGQRHDLDA